MRSDKDWTTIAINAHLNGVVGFARAKSVDVFFEHRLDQLGDACAPRSFGDHVSFILDRWQSICDRDRISTCAQECVVVFGVAD